jgi:hypothetical protein
MIKVSYRRRKQMVENAALGQRPVTFRGQKTRYRVKARQPAGFLEIAAKSPFS